MDRGKSAEESTRQMELLQYSSGAERKKWWPTLQQKQILEGLWASGVRKPSDAHAAEITAVLQQHGRVNPKSVHYWFGNENNRDKRRRRQSEARNCDNPAPSNDLGNVVREEGKQEEEEEAVPRTLELFTLHPDRCGL